MATYYLNPLNFSNPKAAGFLTDFSLTPTEEALVNALVVAADSTTFVGPAIAANTLVAAEIVAASLGQPATDFPMALSDIIPSVLKGYRILAADTISVVMDSVEASITTEESTFSIWEAAQQNLLQRLA